MGIDLQFEEAHSSSEGTSKSQPQFGTGLVIDDSQVCESRHQRFEPIHERVRRNSESTLWDYAQEPDKSARWARSHSLSRFDSEMHDNRTFMAKGLHRSRSFEQSLPLSNDISHLRTGGRVRTWLSTSIHSPESIHSTSDRSTSALQRGPFDNSTSPSDGLHSTAGRRLEDDGVRQPQDVVLLPPETLLDIKAMILRDKCCHRQLSSILTKWHERTLQLRQDTAAWCATASGHDREMLIRQAIETWRTQLRALRQDAETQRFFELMGLRAERARCIFLLTKSLSHWAYIASVEVHKTSLARRHILRARYFTSWREITAVNELKTRRQIIKKFFGLWQRKARFLHDLEVHAQHSYENGLVSKKYRAWVWSRNERKVTVWQSRTLRSKSLATWRSKRSEDIPRHITAMQYLRKACAFPHLRQWLVKTKDYEALDEMASCRHYTTALRAALISWRCAWALLAPETKIKQKGASNLKMRYMRMWRTRANQSRHASRVDHQRISREGFTIWIDMLRRKVFSAHAEHQQLTKSLYMWVIAERLSFLQRILADKVRQRMLLLLQDRLIQKASISRHRMEQALAFYQWHTKLRCIRRLRWAFRGQQELETIAYGLTGPRLTQDVINRWARRLQTLYVTKKWADDGAFCFLMSKALKTLRSATEASRQERRRSACSDFRRRTKIRLATRVLDVWRNKTKVMYSNIQHALSCRVNKTIVTGMEAFDRWRASTDEFAAMSIASQNMLLKKRLSGWHRHSSRMTFEAAVSLAFNEDRICCQCIKQWRRIVLQLMGREFVAGELQDKRRRRLLRRILLAWRQRISLTATSLTDGSATLQASNVASDTANRAEDWSDTADNDIDSWARRTLIMTTPVPGSMTTPSRRLQRIRTVVAQSSTTPVATLSTPFEKMLRDQYSDISMAATRRPRMRNSDFSKDGFEDLHRYR